MMKTRRRLAQGCNVLSSKIWVHQITSPKNFRRIYPSDHLDSFLAKMLETV